MKDMFVYLACGAKVNREATRVGWLLRYLERFLPLLVFKRNIVLFKSGL